MGKVIRKLRICKEHFKLPQSHKLGPISIPKGKGPARITAILHEKGRGAPLCEIQMEDSKEKSLVIAVEGSYVGQQIFIGEGELSVGNCLPLKDIPEGTVVCNIERNANDGGRIAVSSGTACQVVSHMNDKTTIKMPSGRKVALTNEARAFIGIAAGGGRCEKPLLKAGRAFYRNKAKGIYWPRVRGVAMNPVDHNHGGGNHQHIGHPSTISKHAAPGQKVGLIAARRTGLRRGVKKITQTAN